MTEWIFARLLRFYPRAFRERYRDELVAFFRQDREHPKYGSGVLRPVRFWRATLRDLVRTAWSHRRLARLEAQMTPPKAGLFSRLWWDLRFAWRGLWATRGVTIAALAVLTIGIGAGTTVFSVVDAVVLRGLPFPDSSALISVVETDLASGRPGSVAPQNLSDWRTRQHVFENLAGVAGAPAFTTVDEPVETLRAVRVAGALFDILGVQPVRGRVFRADDERTGAPAVAIISDALWRRRFAADPRVVGRTIASGTSIYQIVGVMPPKFTYPISVLGAFDVWLPFVPTQAMVVRGGARTYNLSVIGRLRSGVTLESASRDMQQIRDQLAAEYPAWFKDRGVAVRRLTDAIVGASVRSWMMLLLGAVAVLVLIACLNAANLLVARAVARAPELAVRTALGASRWDLSRGLVVESLVLSLMGATGGILASFWGVEILRSAMPVMVPRLADVAVDVRVLAVAVSTAVATGLLFGTLPALQASRPDVVTLINQSGRSQSASRAAGRLRAGLVVAEVTLAVVLLSGSVLFLASFARVTSVDLGFEPNRVISVSAGATMGNSYLIPAKEEKAAAEAAAGHSLVRAAVDRLRAVPGVIEVAESQGGRPLTGNWVSVVVEHADRGTTPFTGDDEAVVRTVGPGFLEVMRASLLRGRWLAATDILGSAPVVVLSDEAARRYFGAADPVGRRLLLDDYQREVVGVIRTLRMGGPETALRPEAYVPFAQTSHPTAELLVRTASDPAPLLPALRDAVRPVLPALAAREPQVLERDYAALLQQRRFNMLILLLFGGVAAAIAAIGIYGLMAFLVAQRRREIGVRVALGAAPAGILRLVLARAIRVMALGLLLGLGAALLLEQTIRSFLFNATPHDPALYAAAAVVLLASGLAAALGPARRAARLDPLIALRGD